MRASASRKPIFLLLLIILVVCASAHAQKMVVIRDDDVKEDTAALRWFTDLIQSKDAKCTYAVIPHKLTAGCVKYLKNLDPDRFELATHGYDSTSNEDSVALMLAARNLMIADFNAAPRSIAASGSIIPKGYQEQALALGYHSEINNYNFYPVKIFTVPFSFEWETDWGSAPNWTVTYYTFSDFKKAFDRWYSGTGRVFTINVHHTPLYADLQARADFEEALDYIDSKNCIFMTQEQMFEAIKYLLLWKDGKSHLQPRLSQAMLYL